MKTCFEAMSKLVDKDHADDYGRYLFLTPKGTYQTNGYYAIRCQSDRSVVHQEPALFSPSKGSLPLDTCSLGSNAIQEILETAHKRSEVIPTLNIESFLKLVSLIKPAGKDRVCITLDGQITRDNGYDLRNLKSIISVMPYANEIRITEDKTLWIGCTYDNEVSCEALVTATIN